MKQQLHTLKMLIRSFVTFSGWRAGLLVAMMLAAALSEGLGLLLLVPLLGFVGLGSRETGGGALVPEMAELAIRFDVSLSLNLVLALFVLLVIARQLIVYFSTRIAADMRIYYVASVRKEFFASIGRTSWRFLTGGRLDQLSQVLLIDCWRIGQAALNVVRIMSGAILLLANVVVAVMLAPLLASLLLGSISLLTLLFSNRLGVVRRQGGQVSQIHTDIVRVVENYVDNLRVAKMAGAVARIEGEFSATMDKLGVQHSGFSKETESTKMALQLIGAIAVAVALLVAVYGFGASGPELLLLIFITARFIPRLSVLNQNAHSLAYDLPAFEQAREILADCRAHCDRRDGAGVAPVAARSIGVHGVSVVAEDDSSRVILDNVSLQMQVGEMLALVGPSGAGKSTLADVLSGLLLPEAGDIRIDGVPLVDNQILAWRHCVGYVPQTAVLLQDTIEHNLNWVLPQPASELELGRALRCAELSHLSTSLPDGLDTVVDRYEGTLSGGERQRLALARELLRQPQLLILDETTSALDIDNETRILDNIPKYFPAMTVLLISHRPTAIAKADRVLQIANGKLVLPREKVAKTC